MITPFRFTDLAEIVEILEDARNPPDQLCDRLTPAVGPEHDGAPELDVLGEQPRGRLDVTGFDRNTERMHGVPPSQQIE